MMSIPTLGFLNPAVLFWLFALPALWIIIRLLPPQPRKITLPSISLLFKHAASEPPPHKTPLWILIMRTLIATLFIFSLARPIFNPAANDITRPILIVIDDGWESAHNWRQRVRLAEQYIDQAQAADLSVYLLFTAEQRERGANAIPSLEPLSVESARQKILELKPKAWSVDHDQAARALDSLEGAVPLSINWISDNLMHEETSQFAQRLARLGQLRVKTALANDTPLAILPPRFEGLNIAIDVVRAEDEGAMERRLIARGAGGQLIQTAPLSFEDGSTKATAIFNLPADQRNNIQNISIENHASAGAHYLFDESNFRPKIAIISGEIASETPPLKSSQFYLTRALEPFAAIESGSFSDAMDANIDILFLANIGRLPASEETRLREWVNEGGVLVRFAGPRMSEDVGDLIPINLRSGNRAFGGALTWEQPKHLAEFERSSPFWGLTIPDNIIVNSQLLAVPDRFLDNRTWAKLEDGTPIVTAEHRNNGWIILFHATANPDWTNLPLSGLFVEMLKRTLTFARANGSASPAFGEQILAPRQLLDGFGSLFSANDNSPYIIANDFSAISAGTEYAAGYYGTAEYTKALNLASPNGPITSSFNFTKLDINERYIDRGLEGDGQKQIGPLLFFAALFLLIADWLISFWLRGFLRHPTAIKTLSIFAMLFGSVLIFPPSKAHAQEVDPSYAIEATELTRLAYIATGDPSRDQITVEGLRNLGRIMRSRTSVALGDPIEVSPEDNSLGLFPFIYWPVPLNAEPLSSLAQRNLIDYLQNGGMVLFDIGIDDTASYSMGFSNPDAEEALRRLLGNISVPPLIAVDQNHVLSKSYYLLDIFPGRISGRVLWADANSSEAKGAVSSILIGSHDWPSAWASSAAGFNSGSGLEGGGWQREYAFRFGINLVMYVLTGTYKSDQLHIDTIIERLNE